ncbi:UNVERIFIED_CONTAM: Peptidyl-prolyl cis-trans isomerase FKBP19, chloroplastic [Sesamum radiatum]|uniref:peptidylprolyl isomerase n=1 Tax=Sesamum radiatum TaxID=300843 RepID=A0AAW2MZ98_SESRA
MASISAVGSLPKRFPANTAAVSLTAPPLPALTLCVEVPPSHQALLVCPPLSFTFFLNSEGSGSLEHRPLIDRRQVVVSSIGLLAVEIFNCQRGEASTASELRQGISVEVPTGILFTFTNNEVPALRGKDYGKTKMRYPDYTETNSGLQYKDLRVGSGPTPRIGETVVVDWDGYTIGYYGRIFEARNKTKGGSFVGDDKDFYKFRLGSQEVIPAFEEAVSSMALGGIRRIIVPPELGYPENDFDKKGPRPTTFSLKHNERFRCYLILTGAKMSGVEAIR